MQTPGAREAVAEGHEDEQDNQTNQNVKHDLRVGTRRTRQQELLGFYELSPSLPLPAATGAAQPGAPIA